MLERHGFTSWLHHSFIWQNFQTFDDYWQYSTPTSAATLNVNVKPWKSGLRLFNGDEIPKSFPLMYTSTLM